MPSSFFCPTSRSRQESKGLFSTTSYIQGHVGGSCWVRQGWSITTKKRGAWERREKDQGRQEGGSAKVRFCVSSTKKFLFLVHEYLGYERPISIEVLAPTRLSLQGSHMWRKLRQRTNLRSKSSTLKGLLYAPIKQEQYHKRTTLHRLKSRCKLFVARKGRTIALERSVSKKAVKDKQQSTFFFTSWVSLLIPTSAVLRSMANARKCQLKDFCEKKWETHAFCTRNMGAHVRCTYPKKLVSSNLAKILEVATKIRKTCEKHCLLPLPYWSGLKGRWGIRITIRKS